MAIVNEFYVVATSHHLLYYSYLIVNRQLIERDRIFNNLSFVIICCYVNWNNFSRYLKLQTRLDLLLRFFWRNKNFQQSKRRWAEALEKYLKKYSNSNIKFDAFFLTSEVFLFLYMSDPSVWEDFEKVLPQICEKWIEYTNSKFQIKCIFAQKKFETMLASSLIGQHVNPLKCNNEPQVEFLFNVGLLHKQIIIKVIHF